MKKKFYHKGIGLVEVLIAVSIIVIGVLVLIQAFNAYVSFALSNNKNVAAAYAGEEALEVMGYIRDNTGWTTGIAPLATSTATTTHAYYLFWNATTSTWTTTTTAQYVDATYLRAITLRDVFRDSNFKIATSGTFDPNTKLVTATISYFQGHATTTKIFYTYLANIYNN